MVLGAFSPLKFKRGMNPDVIGKKGEFCSVLAGFGFSSKTLSSHHRRDHLSLKKGGAGS
jgi:hypothetical protein